MRNRRAGQHVGRPGPHEPLADAVPHPAGPPVLVARAHRPQVLERQLRVVPADGDPPQHPAPVAVDPVPHQLADEPADLPEALGPVELDHADRVLVPAHSPRPAPRRRVKYGLPLAVPIRGFGLHAVHQPLEVSPRQVQVQVELGRRSRSRRGRSCRSRCRRRRSRPRPACGRRGRPGGRPGCRGSGPRTRPGWPACRPWTAVVNDDPDGRRDRLPGHAVQRPPGVLGLVAAGGDQRVTPAGQLGRFWEHGG